MMRLLIVIAAMAMLPGCAAVLVGGLMYDHAASREDKAKFTQNFQQQNLEREKAGLPKLDWCSEVYKYSKSWAKDQPGCAERIVRYEAGDHAALSI
ncbi:MAG: hypothetical protein AB7O43_19450 [Hyphomicrobiaceae bacterium]